MATDAGPAVFPALKHRLRLGMVGGGGGFIGKLHANGAKLSERWDLVAGALSSDPGRARAYGAEWRLPADRSYGDYREMANREAARPDGIHAVAITTPNASHHPICVAFLEKGIDVICDKPLTTTLADALDLVERQRRTGLVFGVTHAFAAFAMVRQAREMVLAGELGRIRQVHVEFTQDWAMAPIAVEHKGGQWRTDPQHAGPSFTTADIGVHAHHLACFVTGMEMTKLRAELHVCGAPKPLDDTAFMHVRFNDDVPGTLFVSQAATGANCMIRLRIFGEKAALEWDHEFPEFLRFNRLGQPSQTIMRGPGAGMTQIASCFNFYPRGNPQGWLEAWASLYTELALAVTARREGTKLPPGLVNYPTVLEGARGVKFIAAAIESHQAGGSWVDCRLIL
jgi:predicted dehydrogenase